MRNWSYGKTIKRLAGLMGLCLALAGCGGQGSFADLPEVTPYPVPQGQTMRADLYFLDESGAGTLAVESREVDLSYREQGTYWQVIQELILGPQTALLPVCPGNTAINSVMVFRGLAVVDIGETDMDPAALQIFRQALAETLYANAMAQYTLLTVNGRLPQVEYPLEKAEGVYAQQEVNRVALGFYKSRTGEWAILRPVELPEDAVSVEGMVMAVSGENRGEYAICPVGPTARLESYSLEGGTARLSLRGEKQDKPDELGVACLALCLFYGPDSSEMERVELTYNGEELSYRGKTSLIREDVYSLRGAEKILYFADDEGESLIPVRRTVPIQRPLDEFWIIRQILAGPLEGEDADARPLIADTRLTSSFLGGRLSGNLAVLDFDRSFYSYAETLSDGETRLLIYALVNSLTEEGNIEQVLFLRNGENIQKLGSIFLYQPLLRNPGMISGG